MMVYLWKQVPFTTLVLSSVLVGLGKELEEAAATLGASRAQATWHVMLPQVMPGIVSATIIVFAFNFGSFETPFVLGPGHPETLPVAAFRSFTSPDYAQRLDAMAIVTVVAVISAILLWTYIALYRRFERRRGRQ